MSSGSLVALDCMNGYCSLKERVLATGSQELRKGPHTVKVPKGGIMSGHITVTLPDDLMQRAEPWPRRTGRPVADFLGEAIDPSLRPLGVPTASDRSLAAMSD